MDHYKRFGPICVAARTIELQEDLIVVQERDELACRVSAEAAARTETGTDAPRVPAPGTVDDEDMDIPHFRVPDHLMMEAATMLPRDMGTIATRHSYFQGIKEWLLEDFIRCSRRW